MVFKNDRFTESDKGFENKVDIKKYLVARMMVFGTS